LCCAQSQAEQLRAALPWLQAQLPQLKVITAIFSRCIWPLWKGKEIFFTDQQALAENFNGVPLWIRPQSFFQTNPTVASRAVRHRPRLGAALPVRHMWDLFCGVGGFGLHCATPEMR
jgi:23S rRNA (uracil747-C5)-methyltransferase